MAKEIKKDPKILSWDSGIAANPALAEKSSFSDFSTETDYFRPEQSQEFSVKNPSWRTSNGNTFPVFETYKGNKFTGYLSFRRVQGLEFAEVLRSSRTGNMYAKFNVKNRYGAPENTTFGADSLKKVLTGKKLKCLSVNPQQIPAFGADLEADNIKMVSDTWYELTIV